VEEVESDWAHAATDLSLCLTVDSTGWPKSVVMRDQLQRVEHVMLLSEISAAARNFLELSATLRWQCTALCGNSKRVPNML
jgi:hypothetical protein